jgi:hypothetical protein
MAAVAPAVPQLGFEVTGARCVERCAVPTLGFALRISAGQAVRSLLLDTQIQIAARRRSYAEPEPDRLADLFGPRKDWGTTLRTLLWARVTTVVPPFGSEADVELQMPCTYDFEVAASRYLDALAGGDVPLEFLFSGTVFYAGADGRLQAARIPWEQEAELRMPVAVWRETMDRHFRGTSWIRLRKDVVDRLAAYRARHTLASWEETMERLLDG